MGGVPLLQLCSASSTSAANPQKDASAQRHRGVGQDAENRLATVPTVCAVTQ